MSSSTEYLTRQQVAERYHLSTSYLAQAVGGTPRFQGPPYVKLGRRVLYRAADVDAWLAARVVVPTVVPPLRRGRPTKAQQVTARLRPMEAAHG